MKLKNFPILVMILVCIGFSIFRIYNFYKVNVPPFKMGECFEFNVERQGDVDAIVLTNDNTSLSTLAIAYRIYGNKTAYPLFISYIQLRNLNPRSVTCPSSN